VDLEAAEVNVALVAVDAFVGPFPGVETLVQLQVHKLGEFGRAELALVRLLSGVEPQVGFEIAGAAEPLVTNLVGGGRETASEWEGISRFTSQTPRRGQRDEAAPAAFCIFTLSHKRGKKKKPRLFYLNIAEQHFERGRRQGWIRPTSLWRAGGSPAVSQTLLRRGRQRPSGGLQPQQPRSHRPARMPSLRPPREGGLSGASRT